MLSSQNHISAAGLVEDESERAAATVATCCLKLVRDTVLSDSDRFDSGKIKAQKLECTVDAATGEITQDQHRVRIECEQARLCRLVCGIVLWLCVRCSGLCIMMRVALAGFRWVCSVAWRCRSWRSGWQFCLFVSDPTC